jgi:hypothetical protein
LWNIPAGTVETLQLGVPIDQVGFGRELLWARSRETLFFFNRARELIATTHVRKTGVLTWTPEGWYSGTGNPARVIRAFTRNGTPLSSDETAKYLAPSRIMAAFTDAAK